MLFSLSLIFIWALPTAHVDGAPREASDPVTDFLASTKGQEDIPPSPPPADYIHKEPPHPPIPEIKETEQTECPKTLLTSEQIDEFVEEGDKKEEHTKTIDEIIFENTKDINSTSVRELDVAVSGEEDVRTAFAGSSAGEDVRTAFAGSSAGEEAPSKRRRRDADDDYLTEDENDGAEAPGLSINEINEFPPLDDLDGLEVRSDDDTIDGIFVQLGADVANRPMASALMTGRAAARATARNDEVYDMDMILTAEQKKDLFDSQGKMKRAAIKRTYWTNGIIPYSFQTRQFDDKTQIYAAMKEWQSKTCLRFEPYSDSLRRRLGHKNQIFFRNGGGCSSYVGMINTGPQAVTLAMGCRIKSIIMHELGHAIGLHHEQCRPDRDNHVTINKGNVHSSMLYNFDKYSSRSINMRGFPYDYRSIMHYGKTAFTSNGGVTIQTKDRNYINIIGKAKQLSLSDYGVVNQMYQCETKPITTTTTTKRPTIATCKDTSQHCAYWKAQNECVKNPGYMTKYCTKTCGKCTGIECENENKYCEAWKDAGYCVGKYEGFMTRKCAKSCGKCGSLYSEFAELWGTNMPTDSATTSQLGTGIGIAALAATLLVR